MIDVIDSHTHVISADPQRYPTAPLGGHQSTWSRDRPVTHEALIAAMDAAGVSQAVVVQASTVYGHDNSYLVEAVKTHPDRFVGVYSVDVLAPDAVSKIIHWQDEGLFGFRLFTTGSTMPGQADWLGDETTFPAWAHAEANGIPVCLQMTISGLPILEKILTRFPKVRVLLDHLARPELADGPPYADAAPLFAMASYPGVHLKLTNRTLAAAATGLSTPTAFVTKVVDTFGADRIAWGSNFPAAEGDLSALLTEAKTALAALPAEDQAMIFSGTAKRLYPGLAAARS
ncbi:MAG: amidohydrolase family protein [Caulobacteraceae bacterium]